MKRRFALVMLGLLMAAPVAGAADGKPPSGTPIMKIGIPSIGVNLQVVEGDPSANEDGYFPTHYRSTNWPIWGQTVVISAHHYTHALPGADGGPFLHADQLRAGDKIYLTMLPPYGKGTTKYVVTGQQVVQCGRDKINCPAIKRYWGDMSLNRLLLSTCIGDGSKRRLIYSYEKSVPLKRR